MRSICETCHGSGIASRFWFMPRSESVIYCACGGKKSRVSVKVEDSKRDHGWLAKILEAKPKPVNRQKAYYEKHKHEIKIRRAMK